MNYKRCIIAFLVGTMFVINSVVVLFSENAIFIYNQIDEDFIETATSDVSIDLYGLSFEDSEEVSYSVPIQMVQAAKPTLNSMGNSGIDGNAKVTTKNGKSVIQINFKSVAYIGLYGHLLNIWSYPSTKNIIVFVFTYICFCRWGYCLCDSIFIIL